MVRAGFNPPIQARTLAAAMSAAAWSEKSAKGIVAAETSLPNAGRTHEAVKARSTYGSRTCHWNPPINADRRAGKGSRRKDSKGVSSDSKGVIS